MDAVGWYLSNSGGHPHEVGTRQANELGVHDMSGNVWEWCESWSPGEVGFNRVIRGGAWNLAADGCSVASRGHFIPEDRNFGYTGFRVAMSSVSEVVLVTGGTLPASSPLGAVPVDTFQIGKTEVTWGEWKSVRRWAVANGYPDLDGVGEGAGENFPVRSISWYDVVKWCNARSEREGKTPVYKSGVAVYRTGVVSEPVVVLWANGYRLPSDSEWEFAARGGTQSQGYKYSGSNTIDAVGWYVSNSNGYPQEVGTRQANELGVHDMSGNVWEWCGSWSPGEVGFNRVIRGGAWNLAADGCSVASRGHFIPEDRNFGYTGFRVAMSSVSELVLVTGGTLPASSALGAVPVDTFYIGKTEVTWGEWQTVRTWAVANGYTDLANVGVGLGIDYPVSEVSWFNVVKWCNARSEKEGKTPVYRNGTAVYRTGDVLDPQVISSANGYRLPSEKEWEFAARGGTQKQGYTYSGSNDLSAVGWYAANSGGAVHEVSKKQANELGIFDMSGNLWEWSGSWHPNHEGSYRVIRGGYWGDLAADCAVAYRTYHGPEAHNDYNGFRVATCGEYALGITAQPSVSADGTTLSVEAAGVGMLTYQWRLNGAAIAGGTSSQLSTQGLQSGTYTVVVSNGFASLTSSAIQYPSPIGAFALVTGGTLPASSALGAVPVDTFYIGKTEVTWGEWQTVRTWAVANGYTDLANVGEGLGDSYPVTQVNWHDVVKWCNARSEREGKTPVYKVDGAVYKIGQVTPTEVASANGCRLPSEKEWEFAARGGTQTQGYTYSGSNDLSAVGWYAANSGGAVHEVSKKQANELGIFDMSGNLWEWSGNWHPVNQGVSRAFRGGAWSDDVGLCAVSFRDNGLSPEHRDVNFGFRVATSGEYALGFTAQPSVSADGTTLSVEAAGAGTLTYQWSLNGVAIAGGTSSQLSTQGLQSGTYTVVVSNGFASLTSSAIQYPPSPIGTFALVSGGTLPASSPLGAVSVDTFYIGKTEVTWGEWQGVRTWAVANGYTDLANIGQGVGDSYPVTSVNWFDVVKWCNARSEKEGKTPVYKNGANVYRTGNVSEPAIVASANGYRLPSEKEWEFAARGGTQTQGYTYSGSNDLSAVGWYYDNSGYTVHEVGKKLANELGIYDMTGNLWEWGGSWYPGFEGSSRVLRGGNWGSPALYCTVADRGYSLPGTRDFDYGFRVALSSVP